VVADSTLACTVVVRGTAVDSTAVDNTAMDNTVPDNCTSVDTAAADSNSERRTPVVGNAAAAGSTVAVDTRPCCSCCNHTHTHTHTHAIYNMKIMFVHF
jgi:hypothetical protein